MHQAVGFEPDGAAQLEAEAGVVRLSGLGEALGAIDDKRDEVRCVVLTGSDGTIGSAVAAHLQDIGATVIGVTDNVKR